MMDNDTVIGLLEEEFGLEPDEIDPSAPLFSSGMVDSFALVTLMMRLEKLGGFRINPTDVTLDNLDSVDRIVAYVNRVSA